MVLGFGFLLVRVLGISGFQKKKVIKRENSKKFFYFGVFTRIFAVIVLYLLVEMFSMRESSQF